MPLTLLVVFLAFAAPAPLAEFAAHEDEAILEISRSGRTSRRHELSPVLPAAAAPVQPPIPQTDPEVRTRRPAEWSPRLLSRPPPR